MEGHELKVFQGALEFLKRNAYPAIFFEAWSEKWFADQKQELLAFVTQIGYDISHLGGYDHIAQHQDSSTLFEITHPKKGDVTVTRVR